MYQWLPKTQTIVVVVVVVGGDRWRYLFSLQVH
jgi:hypothetical protein